MDKAKKAFLHALKVGFHILLAVVVYGLIELLTKGSPELHQIMDLLAKWGIPVGLTNMVTAGILRYLQLHQPMDIEARVIPDDL